MTQPTGFIRSFANANVIENNEWLHVNNQLGKIHCGILVIISSLYMSAGFMSSVRCNYKLELGQVCRGATQIMVSMKLHSWVKKLQLSQDAAVNQLFFDSFLLIQRIWGNYGSDVCDSLRGDWWWQYTGFVLSLKNTSAARLIDLLHTDWNLVFISLADCLY